MSRAGDPLAVERPQVYKTTNTGEASALRARGREELGGGAREGPGARAQPWPCSEPPVVWGCSAQRGREDAALTAAALPALPGAPHGPRSVSRGSRFP